MEAHYSRAVLGLVLIAGCAQESYSLEHAPTAASTAPEDAAADTLCILADPVVVPGDAVLPELGDAPDVLVDRATGRFHGTLVADGAPIPMTLVIDAGLGEPRYTQATWEGDPADPAAADCTSRLEVDFAATAEADGWLDTSFSSALVFTAQAVRFESPVPVAQVEGSVSSDLNADTATDLCFNAEYYSAGAYWDGWLAWRTGETGPGEEIAAEFMVERVDEYE